VQTYPRHHELLTAGHSESSTTADVETDAIISYHGTEPANPLIPGNTTESGGVKIVGALFRGLVEYDPETGAAGNAVADTISTPDSEVYTITLKPGWTFHDGTPVTAASFIDAWNYTAYAPNGLQGASFLSHIAGYAAVHPDDGTDPTATRLSGLRVVSDREFVVTLSAPFSEFPVQLGAAAFFPLPSAFFIDPKAFEAHPIGNGPFAFVSSEPGRNVRVERYNDYAGARKPHIGGVEFRFYTSTDAAYADVIADELDFTEVAPYSAMAGNRYLADLPGRARNRTWFGIQTFTFPLHDQRYADPRVRQAISMAIDREALIDKVFFGQLEPANGFVPPGIQGRRATQEAGLCSYQPARARELFDASGFDGVIELTSNTESSILPYTELCAHVTKALDRECRFVGVPTLAEFRKKIGDRSVTEIYRSGWIADYPSIENFLNPIYRTGGSENNGGYSNPEVDALLARADAAPSQQAGWLLYQQAEQLILNDMPSIPLWYQSTVSAWSTRLRDVRPTAFRELDLFSVRVAAGADTE